MWSDGTGGCAEQDSDTKLCLNISDWEGWVDIADEAIDVDF